MGKISLKKPVWKTTEIKKEQPVSHTIWICTVNNQEVVDHIYAAIVGLGAEVKAADASGSLYHHKPGAQTTVAAINVSNFKDLKNTEILNKICAAIGKYDYYGIILQNNKNQSSSWRAGNITSGKNLRNTLQKADKAEVVDKEPEQPKPEPESDPKKRLEGKSALLLLTRIIQATTEMSDIFFDDISQQDRRLLARELEKLCEQNGALENLPKQ